MAQPGRIAARVQPSIFRGNSALRPPGREQVWATVQPAPAGGRYPARVGTL